ncbi:MAG: hypothetical protein ACYTCU_09350, partial [Planctomycetota bacterium]
MSSQTKARKEKAPRARTNLRKLEVALPAPPGERRDELPALELFVFDNRRRFLGSAPFEEGRTRLEADVGRARLLRAVVAPRGLSHEAVARSDKLPMLSIDAPEQTLIEFPPGWWDELLFGQLVSYHGRVEKVIGESTLPIRDGIVEVYEVDPWVWIVKLPDLELVRFRDDLLRRIDPA